MGEDARKAVVIIGAGFAGLAAAQRLGGGPFDVVVVDRQNHHLFQPLLYQVATASLSTTDIAQPIRHILRRHRNIEVLRGSVEGIDRERRIVRAAGRALRYDWLIVATGAAHNYFGHEDWARLAPGLKTLAEAQAIRARILDAFEAAEAATDPAERRRHLTFVIVGGGPTGVELAGSIAELARHTLARDFREIDPRMAQVLLFEAGPRLLPSFDEALSRYAADGLAALGVTLRLATPIGAIGERGVQAGDAEIPAATIVWTAGVRSSPAASWLGVPSDRAGRIVVDDALRLPIDGSVFVLGDLAAASDAAGRPLPGLAQVAAQQGRHAAACIRALARGEPAPPFRYRDLGSWAIVGRNIAVAQIGGWRLRGRLAWAAWGAVHIALLVGFENRWRVLFKWIWEYLTRRRGARLILAEAPPLGAPALGSPLRADGRPPAVDADDLARDPAGVG